MKYIYIYKINYKYYGWINDTTETSNHHVDSSMLGSILITRLKQMDLNPLLILYSKDQMRIFTYRLINPKKNKKLIG